MKIFIVMILSLFITNVTNAQDKHILPLQDGKVKYTDIVHVDSVSKIELYKRAKLWLVDSYKSCTNVIQLDDNENGVIIGKGFFEEDMCVLGCEHLIVWQKIKVQIKDGRYKFEFSDFRIKHLYPEKLTGLPPYDEPIEEWNENKRFYSNVDAKVKALIESLNKAMKTLIDDNW